MWELTDINFYAPLNRKASKIYNETVCVTDQFMVKTILCANSTVFVRYGTFLFNILTLCFLEQTRLVRRLCVCTYAGLSPKAPIPVIHSLVGIRYQHHLNNALDELNILQAQKYHVM